jgi:uncharacterized protein YraI
MRFALLITALLLLALGIAPSHAEKRVALVVGNERYANLSANDQLQKAANDARAVAGALRQIGFDVISGENLGRGALLGKLDEFRQRLAPGDTAFFFFSGHGVALDGVNYILPADVPDVAAGQETRLKGEALGEPYIVSELTSRGVRVLVLVLDACRTNPFGRAGGKGIGGERGLAPPPQVKGVFSLYAASNGQAARDRLFDGDPSPNSVFSRVLVPALTRPGLDLTALAFDVREEVARVAQTAGYVQEPAYYDGTIGGRVYLAGVPPARDPVATVPPNPQTPPIPPPPPITVTAPPPPVTVTAPPPPITVTAPATPDPCADRRGDFVIVGVLFDDADNGLRIRSSPSRTAGTTGIIPRDATGLTVDSCNEHWCRVRYGCQSGWAGRRFLSTRANEMMRVVGVSPADPEGLNVRTGPGPNYPTNGDGIPHNATDVIRHVCQPSPSDQTQWCLVTHSGESGWVAGRFLSR